MVVLQRPLDLRREVERELQLLWGRALPHGLADLRVGDLGVQQDLEQLAEQHDRCVGAVGDVELELDQRMARLGVLDADAVVEEVDDLVGNPCCGLGAARQQGGMAEHRVAAADRLAGRVTHVLREHRRRFAGITSRFQSSAFSARSSSSFSIDSPIRPTDRVS